MRTRLSITNTDELPSLGSGFESSPATNCCINIKIVTAVLWGPSLLTLISSSLIVSNEKVSVGYHSAARRHSHSTTRNTADPHRPRLPKAFRTGSELAAVSPPDALALYTPVSLGRRALCRSCFLHVIDSHTAKFLPRAFVASPNSLSAAEVNAAKTSTSNKTEIAE
jgi:hypothetical protein